MKFTELGEEAANEKVSQVYRKWGEVALNLISDSSSSAQDQKEVLNSIRVFRSFDLQSRVFDDRLEELLSSFIFAKDSLGRRLYKSNEYTEGYKTVLKVLGDMQVKETRLLKALANIMMDPKAPTYKSGVTVLGEDAAEALGKMQPTDLEVRQKLIEAALDFKDSYRSRAAQKALKNTERGMPFHVGIQSGINKFKKRCMVTFGKSI